MGLLLGERLDTLQVFHPATRRNWVLLVREAIGEGRDAGLREGHDAGLREGWEETQQVARQAIVDLCEVLGLAMTAEQRVDLEARDLAAMQALRVHPKQHRT